MGRGPVLNTVVWKDFDEKLTSEERSETHVCGTSIPGKKNTHTKNAAIAKTLMSGHI